MKGFKVILFLGLVSLFADMTYEGARSITGPFLETLGASALLVGFVSGFGELVGYGLRIFFGYISDKTRAWWTLTTIGYGVNLIVIPLLGFAKTYEVAIFLILMERFGKAIRTPSRDTILSLVSKKVGEGKGFGIHEALDQVGALLGPLIVSLVFFLKGSFKESFLVLGVPVIFCMYFLFLAKKTTELSDYGEGERRGEEKLKREFWYYLLFISISVLGFVHFQIISYHFFKKEIFALKIIPVLFAIAMGIDALSALFSGYLFDKKGMATLLIVPLLSIISVPLLFTPNKIYAILGVLLWGIVLGMQESVMRASISKLAPIKKRGLSYGIFNSVYGFSFFLGSTIMGLLYDIKPLYLIYFSLTLNLISLIIFLKLKLHHFGK